MSKSKSKSKSLSKRKRKSMSMDIGKKRYVRLPFEDVVASLQKGIVKKLSKQLSKGDVPDRAVAWVVGDRVYLTERGERELRMLRELFGSRPCEICRFWDDGGCVLKEPDACRHGFLQKPAKQRIKGDGYTGMATPH